VRPDPPQEGYWLLKIGRELSIGTSVVQRVVMETIQDGGPSFTPNICNEMTVVSMAGYRLAGYITAA